LRPSKNQPRKDDLALLSDSDQRPQEDQNPEAEQAAADYQEAHKCDGMDPEKAQNLDEQAEDQQNSGSSQPGTQGQFRV
jgi:hypothetical protein